MKIINALERSRVIVKSADFGKTMMEISDKLVYLDPSHKEDEETIIGFYKKLKEYKIKTDFGTPYKFSDANQSVVYIFENKDKMEIDVTDLIKSNPDFVNKFEGKNKENSK